MAQAWQGVLRHQGSLSDSLWQDNHLFRGGQGQWGDLSGQQHDSDNEIKLLYNVVNKQLPWTPYLHQISHVLLILLHSYELLVVEILVKCTLRKIKWDPWRQQFINVIRKLAGPMSLAVKYLGENSKGLSSAFSYYISLWSQKCTIKKWKSLKVHYKKVQRLSKETKYSVFAILSGSNISITHIIAMNTNYCSYYYYILAVPEYSCSSQDLYCGPLGTVKKAMATL